MSTRPEFSYTSALVHAEYLKQRIFSLPLAHIHTSTEQVLSIVGVFLQTQPPFLFPADNEEKKVGEGPLVGL